MFLQSTWVLDLPFSEVYAQTLMAGLKAWHLTSGMNLELLWTLLNLNFFPSFTSWVACFTVQLYKMQPCLTLRQRPLSMLCIFRSMHGISGGVAHYILSGSKFWGDDVPIQFFRIFQGEQLLAYWNADLISSLWLLKSLK